MKISVGKTTLPSDPPEPGWHKLPDGGRAFVTRQDSSYQVQVFQKGEFDEKIRAKLEEKSRAEAMQRFQNLGPPPASPSLPMPSPAFPKRPQASPHQKPLELPSKGGVAP